MQVTRPPCPCPICGRVHTAWALTNRASMYGAGNKPSTMFSMTMSPDQINSAIYGPMWKALDPSLKCQPISQEQLKMFHRGSQMGQTSAGTGATPVGWIALIIVVALAVKHIL